MADNTIKQRPDALWSDEQAYSFIDELFSNGVFLSVAQESVKNHGWPADVEMDKFEKNFDNIMQRWAKNPPSINELDEDEPEI